MFKQYEIDFGTIRVGQTAEVMFETINAQILEVHPGCPKCTKYIISKLASDPTNDKLVISYKAESIPIHLAANEYNVKKSIDVLVKDLNDGLRKMIRIYIKGIVNKYERD